MADYDTLQKKRNALVGGFVIIGFCAFVWILFRFGELPLLVSQFRSFQITADFRSAPGVQDNTPVKYCGYQVGRVMEVKPPFLYIEPETGLSYHKVRIVIAIDRREDFFIPSNVAVKIKRRSMGSSYIELQPRPGVPILPFDTNRPETVHLIEGVHLEGELGVGSELAPEQVQKMLPVLVENLTNLAGNINTIVGDAENQANLKQSLANTAQLTAKASETLDVLQQRVDEVGEGLAETLAEVHLLLNKITSGDGTAAKLLNDAELYENLLDSSEELKLALEQLKEFATDTKDKGLNIKDGINIKLW